MEKRQKQFLLLVSIVQFPGCSINRLEYAFSGPTSRRPIAVRVAKGQSRRYDGPDGEEGKEGF
jgi:hypothetical protein